MTADADAKFDLHEPAPVLADDEIHVWSFRAPAGPARAIGAAARTALERLLCAYAGCTETPAIERSVHGKPFAPALPELDFNLSHAGPHVLLAFARRQPLGIDLEQCDRRISTDDIARRFFTATEADALLRLPASARMAAFLDLWTHKEAVLKAFGQGIGFGLDRVEFALDAAGAVAALRAIAAEAGAAGDWQLRRLRPAPGLTGALAWRGAARTLRTYAYAA